MRDTNEILRWMPAEPELRSKETVRLCKGRPEPGSVSVGELTGAGPTVEFVLSNAELAALLRPVFIRHLATTQPGGRRGKITSHTMSTQLDSSWSHFMAVHTTLLPDMPSHARIAAIVEGPKPETIDVNLEKADIRLLDRWSDWMWERYVTFPGENLAVPEKLFLTAAALEYPDDIRIDWHHQIDEPPLATIDHVSRVSEFLRAVDPTGVRWPDPESSMDDILGWLLEPDVRGLPRYAQMTYWSRPDLRQAFRPESTAVEQFLGWLHQTELSLGSVTPPPERNIGKRVLRTAKRTYGIARGKGRTTLGKARPTRAALGVNIVGFLSALTGLGAAARASLDALELLDIPHSVIDVSSQIPTPRVAGVEHAVGVFHDTTIFHLNPGELDDYLSRSLLYRSTAGRNIGYFFWETEEVPQGWIPVLSMIDEIWTATDFVAEGFRKATSRPVHRVGYALSTPAHVGPERQRFGWKDDEFVVLFVADARSGIDRKNPLALVDAFERAFGPACTGVRLVLKLTNLSTEPGYRDELLRRSEGLPVDLIEATLSTDDLWTLLASADLYASLHCSEGLGLSMMEAMSIGVPVLATGYGGNTDFTNSQNAFMVDYEMVDASPGPGGLYRGHRWARPLIDHAADLLRHAYDHPGDRRERAGLAQELIATQFSPRTYAATIGGRLSGVEAW